MSASGAELYVGLVRALNIGGRNRLSMAKLKETVKELLGLEVRTYIQTGNLIFTASSAEEAKERAQKIGQLMAEEFGLSLDIMLRSKQQLEAVRDEVQIRIHKAASTPPQSKQVHVGFLHGMATSENLEAIDFDRCASSKLFVAISGSELLLHTPSGMAKTKFTSSYLEKASKLRLTFRNLNTIETLLELLQQE